MKKKIILLIDAFINLILGIILLIFSPEIVGFLGVPPSENSFYPTILGAVLFGIGIALVIEAFRKHNDKFIGLGLLGAICINICGGLVLLLWLLSGELSLPQKGSIFLWILDILLVGISSVELFLELKK
jgi:hypothetical protein